VKFINLKSVKNREGNLIVMNRNGEIASWMKTEENEDGIP